jgi:hypothetical protein
MSFTFRYELNGAGWATARLTCGELRLNMEVSYLHDSLRELAEAARAINAGAGSARVLFMDEPGETQLLLSRFGDRLRVEGRWFDDWNSWGLHPSDEFRVVFVCETTVRRFVGEVTKELETILRQYGRVGYLQKWDAHEFPEELLTQLRAQAKFSVSAGEQE